MYKINNKRRVLLEEKRHLIALVNLLYILKIQNVVTGFDNKWGNGSITWFIKDGR